MNSERPEGPALTSRLPLVGTTIFTVMSNLAHRHGAINLGQGFPDFEPDPRLVAAVTSAMQEGYNQYPPMTGVPALRECISDKLQQQHARRYDPDQEITVTAGATQAILTAILALVHPGDEVIVLEPCYDSYVPAIELAGATAVRVPLRAQDYRPDFTAIRAALTARTRALVINSPHNPTGVAWQADELDQLAQTLRGSSVWVISDEVYEHMVFDGRRHASVCAHRELAARSLLISSFGKTFHVTGWKVGFVAAPSALMAEFRKVHQFNVFTVNAPMQHGLARHLRGTSELEALPAFYQAKRDRFRSGLQHSRFDLLPCEGTYFQCVGYDRISAMDDQAFCRWLTQHVGVAAIPLSSFSLNASTDRRIRFCFAKQDRTLDQALERLSAL